jgi:hypothetical protein
VYEKAHDIKAAVEGKAHDGTKSVKHVGQAVADKVKHALGSVKETAQEDASKVKDKVHELKDRVHHATEYPTMSELDRLENEGIFHHRYDRPDIDKKKPQSASAKEAEKKKATG